jgi:hypothetical protein
LGWHDPARAEGLGQGLDQEGIQADLPPLGGSTDTAVQFDRCQGEIEMSPGDGLS